MKKTYNLQCPVARALDVLGERWTCLILRDLVLHKTRRFQDLQDSLAGIAPNTLSDRLKGLESNDLVERRIYAEHPPRMEYVLTPKGLKAGLVVKALRDWGSSLGK